MRLVHRAGGGGKAEKERERKERREKKKQTAASTNLTLRTEGERKETAETAKRSSLLPHPSSSPLRAPAPFL